MNEKKSKKIRQLYRKEVRKEANEMGRLIGNAMKPKPKWIPWRIWIWGASIFIKIK